MSIIIKNTNETLVVAQKISEDRWQMMNTAEEFQWQAMEFFSLCRGWTKFSAAAYRRITQLLAEYISRLDDESINLADDLLVVS